MRVPKARVLTSAMLLAFASGLSADDGELQIRNVSKTPDWDTKHATLEHLLFYVPAQTSRGDALTIEYLTLVDDPDFVTLRDYARPLVALYEDGPAVYPEDSAAFYGHGERDMYAATSLDDGATWKRRNLSESADKSSIRVDNDGIPEEWDGWYRGDVFRNFTASAGNKVLAVWASRYCDSGNPTYSMEIQEIEDIFASDLVDTSNLGDAEACTDDDADDPMWDPTLCPYFEDYWHVAGAQQVKDFTDEGFETVGEVPYACMWAARGTLELLDDGTYGVVWRKAERLTSGLRDAHRMEAAAVPGAGFVVTWQEDPEGLRPGMGEGPGEGWSAAVVHHETDIWYSYIDWDNFDLVKDDAGNISLLIDYVDDGAPKVGVPMSIPIRLTDNAMCQLPDAYGNSDDPYCYIDFDSSGAEDNCADSAMFPTDTPEGPDQTVYMCVAEDGRLMRGNTGSARARTNLRGYDADADGITESAWVVMGYEEHKGLGEEEDLEPEKIDMGKTIQYHTFDMFNPELVSQGLMLNQPAVYPDELFPLVDYLEAVDANPYIDYEGEASFAIIDPDPVYEAAGLADTVVLYQTEIARRYSQITQPASKAGESGTVAYTMFKQGVVRQGGPADAFARRFIIPDEFDATVDNPFDYANMECTDWLFTDGSNPRYVKGLCLSTPQNMSATTIVECEDGVDSCTVLDFPFDDLMADIDKSDDPGGLPKTTEWRQCADGAALGDYTCDDDDIDDLSWENPYDVAKGHRGFMKGDFIMAMYAWTPNWEANTEGHDNYNLYVRRSFDGGATWTTLPADFSMPLPEGVEVTADGTMHCEYYGLPGTLTEIAECVEYGAGEFEQARNLSQLVGTHDTVLDPRFTGTSPTITLDMIDGVLVDDGATLYPDDVTDPSKFFATYEIGEVSEEGTEATPMDMRYARAVNYGDDYELADTDGDQVPDVDCSDGECEEFDKLEWHEDVHAAEAALKANPGGTLFYAIYNEWTTGDACLDTTGGGRSSAVAGDACNMDATVRRTMELGDAYVTLPTGGDGDGGEPNDDPPGGGGSGDGDDDDD